MNHKLEPVESKNGYYAGIQIYEQRNGTLDLVSPPVNISEGDEEPRKLYPVATLPITCHFIFYGCQLVLKVVTKDTAQLKSCSIRYIVYTFCLFHKSVS